MTTSEKILNGVRPEPQYEAVFQRLSLEDGFNQALGFLTLADISTRVDDPYKSVVGFGAPSWQLEYDELPEHYTPATELDELPLEMHTIDHQSKGVGPRLYNTPQALAGTKENPLRIGAYLIRVNTNDIRDERRQLDGVPIIGAAKHIVDHRALRKRAEKEGIGPVVHSIHERQGKIDALLLNHISHAQHKRSQRRLPKSAVREEFLIVRNRYIMLTKIGEYQR